MKNVLGTGTRDSFEKKNVLISREGWLIGGSLSI